ncbi:MAG: ABC transporter substrate-binding protein, partial [Thermodesulfobacteriota bacterium]
VNEQGGIHGRKIELIAEDDGYKPTEAVAALKKLIDRDQVFAIIGALGGANVKVVMPIAEENKIPYLWPSAATIGIVHPVKRYVFGYYTQYDRIFVVLTDLAVQEYNAKKISVFYPDQEVGHNVRDSIIRRLKKYNMQTVENVAVKQTDVDFSGVVAKLKSSGVDTVMIATHIPATVAFLKECRRQNYNPTCLQDPSGTDPMIFSLAKEPEVTNGLIGSTYMPPIDSEAEPVNKWRADMAKFSQAPLTNYALMAYNVGAMFCDAAKAVGKDLTREALIKTLETWRNYDNGLSGPITYGPDDHEGSEDFFVVQAKDNKWEMVFDKRVGVKEKLVRE